MNIAIVITHDKGNAKNVAQIAALNLLITKVPDQYSTYTIKALNTLGIPHTLRVYQILPFGVPEPSNFYNIDSHNVLYRAGDEDKTANHPRFFNWGLKRGTDYGADLVIHLEDITGFSFSNLLANIQKLNNPTDKTEYTEDANCKIATVKLLRTVGLLDENLSKPAAIANLKSRVLSKGLLNG